LMEKGERQEGHSSKKRGERDARPGEDSSSRRVSKPGLEIKGKKKTKTLPSSQTVSGLRGRRREGSKGGKLKRNR